MGLPDFHSIQQQYVSYYSNYLSFFSSVVGDIEIFNYNNFGKLIYLNFTVVADTAKLNLADQTRLYIDGVFVSSDLIEEFRLYTYNHDTSFIYPIYLNTINSITIACRNGIQFNNNITLIYNKSNIGQMRFDRFFTVGLY